MRIYNDILLRLCVGEFSTGSSLPSLCALCEQYNAGKNTIIAALELLKKNGLIATGRGKAATVIFDYRNINKKKIELPTSPVSRRTRFDYYHAVHVIFPPIFARATIENRDMLKQEFAEIIEALPADITTSGEYIFLNMRFIKAVNTAVDNQLIDYIIKRILQAILLPAALFYGQSEIVKMMYLEGADIMRTIYAAVENNSRDRLEIRWRQLFICTQKLMETAINNDDIEEITEKRNDTIFESADELKCFLIAYELQTMIINGVYKEGSSLPSIAQAKSTYQVSTITIRSAYQILSEIGIAKTTNGCGTIVKKKSKSSNSNQLKVVSSARVDGYIEAVDFFNIVGFDVLIHASNVDIAALRFNIDGEWNPERRYSLIILLYYVFNGAGSVAFLKIFKVVARFLYWGIYMQDVPAFGNLSMSNHQKCHQVISLIEQGKSGNAERIFKELLGTLCPK